MLRALASGVAGSALLPTIARAFGRDGVRTIDPNAICAFDRGGSEAPAHAARIERVGLQLYTVRKAMSADVDGTIAAVAAAGVTELEFAGYYNRTPAQWNALLKQHKLTAPSAHIGLPATDELWKPQFDIANGIGHQWIIVPSVSAEYRGSEDAFKRLGARLNSSGQLAKAAGLRIGYHNHDDEFRLVGSKMGYEVLMESIDPSLVDMEIDLYWAVKAGQDPLAMIARWPGRYPLCHVKDAGPLPDRKMTDVGSGTIDFASIFKQAKKAGFKHWFIEHDQPADGVKSVEASASYLRNMRF